MAAIGIDLGTTNSLISYFDNGTAKLIPNVFNKNLTPSVVSVDDNGEILVGEVAKERLITHPETTAASFKRFMGTNKKFNLGKYTLSPEELSSFILKSLKNDAESYLGEEVNEAVISVPAYFNEAQRKATKRAGELAGLKVERLISEPTAAAIAYGLHTQSDDTQFLVFDLGGGTFDVSVLEFFDGVMEVKSIAGDNFLGGEDFNNVLMSYFLSSNHIDKRELDSKTTSFLYKQAELCKKELSNKNVSSMSITINDKKYETEVSRERFEKICEELILRLKHPVERALRDADISSRELDAVILIGGSTRMPLVRSVVSKMFNKLPFSNINPDETVALGAGIQAALKERDESLKEVVLTDVCPYTLGVEVRDENGGHSEKGIFLPIIERNSPIPISRVEENLTTVCHMQRKIAINVYQGESRHVADNVLLGTLNIKVPPAPAGKERVDVRFTYDINGLLEVEVTVLSTNKKEKLVIEQNPGVMSDDEIEERLKALSEIKIHPREQAANRLILARGERLFEESLGEKRAYISQIMAHFESVLETQNVKAIKEEAERVTELFDELEF